MYSTCHCNLGIEVNRLLAEVISSLTASLRHDGALNLHVTGFIRIGTLPACSPTVCELRTGIVAE